MIGRIHVPMSTALHVVYNFLIAVDGRVLAPKIQLCIHRHLICLAIFVLVNSSPDKIHPVLFILAHGK